MSINIQEIVNQSIYLSKLSSSQFPIARKNVVKHDEK